MQHMRLDQQLARALGWAGVGVGLAVLLDSRRNDERQRPVRKLPRASTGPIHARQSVAIQKDADDLYRFFRELERLPLVMRHLVSVRRIDDRKSHWQARGLGGEKLEWEAELTADEPHRLLAWRAQAPAKQTSRVEFEPLPHGRGTRVTLELDYPAPATGAQALFVGGPQRQLKEDLRRVRQLMETGEIATTSGQPSGRRSLISRALP